MYEQVSSSGSRGDRISTLPDEIICIILSNLSVEESARTSILSKRWRKLWLLSPITISDESIIMQSHTYSNQEESNYSLWIISTLTHIISTHPGPVRTCNFILPIWDENDRTLVRLLRTLTRKGIQNLQIYCKHDLFEVPCFVLECKSLVDVELWCVGMPAQLHAGSEIFPKLRKLTMVCCYVNHEFLVHLLFSKSLIELKLSACYGLKDVVIESDSLHKFSFFVGHLFTELIIKDAPNLELFNYYDLPRNSSLMILDAPKLKVLSCDMDIFMLQLGNHRFRFHKKYMKISGKITYMSSLRSLNIIVDIYRGYEAKSILHFLKCFPYLEILGVKIIDVHATYSSSDSSSDDEYDDNDNNDNDDDLVVVGDDFDDNVYPMSNINCLNHHLKILKVENYPGRQVHLDFANHIIKEARVLERVTLVYGKDFEENWIKDQKRFLMQNKASKMLRVEFIKKE